MRLNLPEQHTSLRCLVIHCLSSVLGKKLVGVQYQSGLRLG